MKTSSDKIFDDYVQAAKLKNASLRYCFARDVFDQVGGLTEKFDAEIHAIIHALSQPEKKNEDTPDDSTKELARSSPDEKKYEDTESKETESFEPNQHKDKESKDSIRMRKLFKQIAVKCHPDKLMNKDISSREFHFLLSSYETARQALDDEDEPSMICTGIDLQIVGELGAEGSFKLLNDASAILEKKSEELRKSALWVWGTIGEDINAKTRVLCSILAQFYGKNMPEERVKEAIMRYFDNEDPALEATTRTTKRRSGSHPGKNLRQRRNHDR